MSHAQLAPPSKQTDTQPVPGPRRARPEPAPPGTRHALLRLQATHGNRAVLRMLDARAPVLQRCADGGGCGGGCAACTDERPALQRRLQRREAAKAATPPAVPAAVDGVLSSPGQPLDTWVRAEMEPRFGRDLGQVRVHTDAPAAASARAVDALAYTVGSHIVFAAGQLAPHSPPGRRLLAHELAHVVQQSDTAGMQTAPDGIAPADGIQERHAEAAAEAVLAGERPANLGPVRGSIQRAPAAPPQAPPSVGMAVTLSGLVFTVPDTLAYRPGRKSPQLLAIMLQRLLGPNYKPELIAEAESALGKTKFERLGGFKDPKPAKGGEPMGQHITLAVRPALTLLLMLKGKKLELQLTPEQEDLLILGEASLNLWVDFLRTLKQADLPLPAWYTRDIFEREMAQHGLILKTYADYGKKAQTSEVVARTGARQVLSILVGAIYQPAMVLEAVRRDISLAANDKTSGVYSALWQLPKARKGQPPKVTAPPTRLRGVGEAVLFLGYMRTQEQLAAHAEEDPKDRLDLVTRYAAFTRRLMFTATAAEGDEQIRDVPTTSNAPAFPSTLTPLPDLTPPLFEAALGTDHRFHMEVQFPSVYEALGRYAFTWERVRVPDDKIGQPVDVTKLKGEEVTGTEVAAVRFDRATAYAKEDLQRVIDGMKSDVGPAGVGALELVGANAILRYIGTGIRLAFDILTMPENQQLVVFPSPGLYMVRSAMSQVREGNEEVTRAPSVAYYPVLARDPDEMATGGVTSVLTAREKAQQRIKELEAKLARSDLGPEERTKLQKELAALRESMAPLGQRLESRRAEAAKRVEAISSGAEPGDLEAAVKDQENIEKQIGLRAKRKIGEAELLTARFVSDLGQTIPLLLEVVDKPVTKENKAKVYVSDVTTPKSGDETGTGQTRDDAIVDAVKTLLEGVEGYGRGRVALALSGGVRTIRIAASKGSLLVESVENVATALAVAAIAAAPLTEGASLAFLVPLGLVGAIPSAYRVYKQWESGTFELDLNSALEIVNIAGSLIGLGRLGATSLRMMRVGKVLLLIGFGVDAAGALMMGAQFMQQIEALRKLPPGERSAALMMLIGQTMLSSGVTVGGSLVERAHHQRAEAQGGKLKGLVDERPGVAEPGRTPVAEPPTVVKPTGPTDAMAATARVDADMKRLGGMDPQSEKRLRADEPLRSALADHPLAAGALKKCLSPDCFPPGITAEQVVRLERALSRMQESGGFNQAELKKYLYDRRANLDEAIGKLEGATNGADFDAQVKAFNEGRNLAEAPVGEPAAAEPPKTAPVDLDARIAEAEAELHPAAAKTLEYQARRRAAGESLKGGPIKGIWNVKERIWILKRQKAYSHRTILEQPRIVGVRGADGTVKPAETIAGSGRTPDFVEVQGTTVVAGDLKSAEEIKVSVKGGVKRPKAVEGEFRPGSKIGGQHEVEGKLLDEARKQGGKLVIEGRNVLTGKPQTLEVDPADFSRVVVTYEDVLPN
jgi:hypothetical protein